MKKVEFVFKRPNSKPTLDSSITPSNRQDSNTCTSNEQLKAFSHPGYHDYGSRSGFDDNVSIR